MKKETILKTMILLIVGVILFVMPVRVFAVTSDATDINNFWEDQGSLNDISGNTTTETNTNTDTDTNTNTNTNMNTNTNTNTSTNTNVTTDTNSNKYDTNIPKAGIAENTIMVVTIAVLAITAIYAYKKINEYKNI